MNVKASTNDGVQGTGYDTGIVRDIAATMYVS